MSTQKICDQITQLYSWTFTVFTDKIKIEILIFFSLLKMDHLPKKGGRSHIRSLDTEPAHNPAVNKERVTHKTADFTDCSFILTLTCL